MNGARSATYEKAINMPLVMLAIAAFASVVAFMTFGLRGNIGFVLELRALKLLALVQVGVAIAVSTVLFQTISGNRILTPSIMGLDALYLLCQTVLVLILGGLGFSSIDPMWKFAGEVAAMMALAFLLFLPMLKARIDLTLLLLSGVILGVLFRSLSQLVARMIDPNDFAVLQGASFASFNSVRTDLLVAGTLITCIGCAVAWRARNTLDVLALGANTAIGLGVEWRRYVTAMLLLVAALVGVSTALVGPVAFFGLLVAALGERIVKTQRHALLLPAAALLAIIVLVGGQAILQHMFGGAATLGMIVEFIGGIIFVLMLLSAGKR